MEFLVEVILALLAATGIVFQAFLNGPAVSSGGLYAYRPPQLTYDCSNHYCSWTQDEGSLSSAYLRLNATDDLVELDDWPLACKPHKFGYSPEDASRLFKNKEYPSCAENSDGSYINFDPETDEFELFCPKELTDADFKGAYVLGDSVYKERQGRYPFEKDLVPYKGKVKVDADVEFVYATCHRLPKTVEHVAYRVKTKPEVTSRVQAQMKEQQLLVNSTHETRPLTVIHLVLDSLSRSHFYRNFPETIAYINSQADSPRFQVFDFKINNVMGNNSPPNVIPFMTGKIDFEERREAKEDFLGPSSLYSRIRDMVSARQGFVTLLGTEFCHRYYSWYMGEALNVDHIMSSFWCAAKKFSGFWDIAKDRRCIGQNYSHHYLLQYGLEFTKRYAGLNQWLYLDSLTAHEDTGTVIRTMDADVRDFLKAFLEGHQGDFVVYLEADHGMRYGDWFKLLDGAQEHKLPAMIMFASRGLLSRVPGAVQTLNHNSARLVSKFDWYALDRFLSYLPYTDSLSAAELAGIIQETESNGQAVHLMLQRIPNSRTCPDINIPPFFCSCIPIEPFEYSEDEAAFIDSLAKVTLDKGSDLADQ
jgi:hypothetical protein